MAGDTNGVLDPKLAPLGFTGGPTPTHRIEGDSPALDAGEISIPGGTGLPDSSINVVARSLSELLTAILMVRRKPILVLTNCKK